MLSGGYSIGAVSKGEEEVKELVRRLAVIFDNVPFISRERYKARYFLDVLSMQISLTDQKTGLTSVFKGFTSNQSAGVSFTFNLIFLDEWAVQAFAREIWGYIFPTVNRPTGGKVIGISTNERGTLFEDMWQQDDNGFNHIFIPWNADPRRTKEWYQSTLKAIGKDKMAMFYPSTAEEAMSVPGGAYFDEFDEEVHVSNSQPRSSNIRWIFAMDYGRDMFSGGLFWIEDGGYARLHREINIPGLSVSAAAEKAIELCKVATDKIYMFLAPPDLWHRAQETGLSTYDIFLQNGITLTKAQNGFEAGCYDLHEWLRPRERQSDQTEEYYNTAFLTIDPSCTTTIYSLKSIQKDKNNPNRYAPEPHKLTHSNDMLRYFVAGRPRPLKHTEDKPKKLIDILVKKGARRNVWS